MEYRDLKQQYHRLEHEINEVVLKTMAQADFISGSSVRNLEKELEEYVGVKHCISCANGTDALYLALKAWGIGPKDAVFVPDFTFFSSGEVVSQIGATPVFVDVLEDTFNIDTSSLEEAIKIVIEKKILTPRVIIAVDLFGQPADYDRIRDIANKYNLLILEDGAQGFGGMIDHLGKRVGAYGDISTTSFFPAKPLGCYGDGGAIFTDNDEIAELLCSLRVHGKGEDKYDNVRIGLNSRLDTIQAAILSIKLKAFRDYELEDVNIAAERYHQLLNDMNSKHNKEFVKVPMVRKGYFSSWAQYTILVENKKSRDDLQNYLKDRNIPSMIYYKKPMHLQKAFSDENCTLVQLKVTESLCDRVLSLPIHPYITEKEQTLVVSTIEDFFKE